MREALGSIFGLIVQFCTALSHLASATEEICKWADDEAKFFNKQSIAEREIKESEFEAKMAARKLAANDPSDTTADSKAA